MPIGTLIVDPEEEFGDDLVTYVSSTPYHKEVTIYSNRHLEPKEVDAYAKKAYEKYGDYLQFVVVNVDPDDDEYAELTYHHKPFPKFERLRRITGYLVGTMDRWNDAKAAEERDRVKHTL